MLSLQDSEGKKYLSRPKVTLAEEKMYIRLPRMLLKKVFNMHTGTGKRKNNFQGLVDTAY
jgi:hypothetical protein